MVSTEVKDLSNCKKELKITIPVDDVNKIRQEQIKNVRKEATVQGFRKGNAPKNMVIKMYAGTIEQYTLDEAIHYGFENGVKEGKVEPVGQPVVKKIDFDDKKNLILEFEVETYPEIKLNKYKDLKLEKEIYNITEEDIEDQLYYLRKQKAITLKENKSGNGDYITINVQEIDTTGMPLIGKKYDNLRFQLGEGQFDPEIESQIIGLKMGENKLIEKRYPQNRKDKQSSEKIERYDVSIVKIEEEELPELNDDFAKNLGFEIKSLAELREKVKEQLNRQWGQESEQRFYNQFVHELLQQNPFEVPESMVSKYLDQIVDEIRKKDEKLDLEEVRKNYRVDALFNIKWFYLKEKIAKEEGLVVSEEDIDVYLKDIEDEKVRQQIVANNDLKKRIMNDIFEKKVFKYLVEHSKIAIKKQPIKRERT